MKYYNLQVVKVDGEIKNNTLSEEIISAYFVFVYSAVNSLPSGKTTLYIYTHACTHARTKTQMTSPYSVAIKKLNIYTYICVS